MDIESSDRADVINEEPRRMPRQPTNLQTLLRFALDATKPGEEPAGAEAGPMEAERRRFLEEALKSLTVDVPKVLQRSIRVLTNQNLVNNCQFGEPLDEDVKAAFNNMMEFVDDIDVANDFQKLGGFAVFPICYGSENEMVRIRASQLLAEVCQNNPNCQARVLDFGLLNVLMHLANSEKEYALAKCLSAISSAIREFEPGSREFISQGGCDTLLTALPHPFEPSRSKAAFLIRYLCQNYPEARKIFIKQNTVKMVAELLKEGRDGSSEHLLSVLEALTEGKDLTALQQLRDPNLNLKHILEEHLKHPELVGDTFIEEKEYCESLLKLVENFPQAEVVNNEVDR